ncbi:hypothetical protein EZV61_09105 [Corallincola luteus]|uniref:Leucine rich repeat variant n=1 Tax=Corallincola luteus TaxID=1775177 RepID=A0ABY2AN27_9GAMM|nr:hypothetical protein [Corallincola luteus]TCI03692.1 hypothetical protein EZV61_09105 [Corallincola luteus]
MDRSIETKTYLETLRLKDAQPEELAKIAELAAPLFCCAATLHPCADRRALEAAARRDDLPLWAQIGLALYSDDEDLLDGFINSSDKNLHLAVSDNPYLTKCQALSLIANSDDLETWAFLGSRHLDSVEVLQALTCQKGRNSAWQARIKSLLNPCTAGKRLKELFWNMKPRTVFVARLIARHPRCPSELLKLLACYLPLDVARNPTYVEKMQNAPQSVGATPFSKNRINEYLGNLFAPAFLLDWLIDNDTELKNLRRCISSVEVNPNKVRWMVVSGDSTIQRKFVQWRAGREYSEYEYRMLAFTGGPGVKKLLVKWDAVSDALLLELVNDRSAEVAELARELAVQRNLKFTVVKSKKKSPNKAQRIETAINTTEPEKLLKLAKDRAKDVRASVANNVHTPVEALSQLAFDTEDSVSFPVLERLVYFGPQSLIRSSKFQHQVDLMLMSQQHSLKVRSWATLLHKDTSRQAPLYSGTNRELDRLILSSCGAPHFIEEILASIREDSKPEVAKQLARNSHMTLEQKLTFPVEKYPDQLSDLLLCTQDKAEYMMIVRKFKDVVNLHGITRVTSSEREDFSSAEIFEMYEEFQPNGFLALAGGLLHKLPPEKAVLIFEKLINLDKISVCNSAYCPEVSSALRDMLIDAEKWDPLCSLITLYPQPKSVIQELVEKPAPNLHACIALNYTLTEQQVTQLISSKDSNVREALAKKQSLSEEQLDVLCRDLEIRVINGLLYSDKVSSDRLPTWTICRAMAPGYSNEIDKKAQALLEERGIRQDMAYLEQTAVLELFDLAISTRKFNQLLAEHGVIELVDDYGGYNNDGYLIKAKQFTRKARHFGFDLSDKDWKSQLQFFPVTFPDLLAELGVPVSP